MADILERLRELYKQATTERSHFYVASVVKDAAAEISRLRHPFLKPPPARFEELVADLGEGYEGARLIAFAGRIIVAHKDRAPIAIDLVSRTFAELHPAAPSGARRKETSP